MGDLVNSTTSDLKPYPMEELKVIKKTLLDKGMKVYDFGTGDPKIPTESIIIEKVKNSIGEISQYPSIKGTPTLYKAQIDYLSRRFNLKKTDRWDTLPTRGSKEAIFHVALCLVGRNGRDGIIFPDPGYPVYQSSISFAGGTPYPVLLNEENDYLLEPWNLPNKIVDNTAALWINYPYNPTGSVASDDYFKKVISWCHENDVILLSDDCYNDMYDCSYDDLLDQGTDLRPGSPITISQDRVLSFMSLSKRSGMTGYRSGLIAGDANLIKFLTRARANMGLSNNEFISEAAALAWSDDQHVKKRRKIFTERINTCFDILKETGLVSKKPTAGFYIWCKVPQSYKKGDIEFAKELADRGVICSPSSWLSINCPGYVRFALVPEIDDIKVAMNIVKDFVSK